MKQIEDYPELDGFIGDNEYGDANGVSVIQSKLAAEKLVSMQNEIERLKSALSNISEYKFKHENGEERTVTIDRKFVVNNLIDELYEEMECNCEPIGETNVIDCDCFEYTCEFKLEELNK